MIEPAHRIDVDTPRSPGSAEHHDDHGGVERADLVRIGLVAIAVAISLSGVARNLAPFDVVALVATVVGGYPIFREAWEAVVERRMTMELSMTIALAAACVIGEFFTALVIVLFVLVAEVLEGLTVGRGRKAIHDLVALLPRHALVNRDGQSHEVPADTLTAGDLVLVKPGGRIPVDGEVVSGHSFVDQSSVTGESLASEKVPGSPVYAGTVNQAGMLEVCCIRVGRDTTFGRIVEAVEHAEQTRAPIQKTADRMAGYLVYFALGCALLTFAITRDPRATISVIIVAGACGIAAGTPLAILGAIGRSARAGVIVKGGLHLEQLGRIDTVVLDKTGTLTLGLPTVVAVRPAAGQTEASVLAAAAAAEGPSEHPLARAILQRARSAGTQTQAVSHFSYVPGNGIACMAGDQRILVGNRSFLQKHDIEAAPEDASDATSSVHVAVDGVFVGSIAIADVLRPDAVSAVSALRKMGLRTILLTGDRRAIAEAVGRQLAVDEVGAELLPEDKLARIRTLQAEGRIVAMVGDGVNDAPALGEATVGIAMGSGTDVARKCADIVLLGDDLSRVVEAYRIALACKRIIWQNFYGTIVVDALGVGLAAFGVLNPLFAAFIHVASELAFILNSTRSPARARLRPRRAEGRLARAAPARSGRRRDLLSGLTLPGRA